MNAPQGTPDPMVAPLNLEASLGRLEETEGATRRVSDDMDCGTGSEWTSSSNRWTRTTEYARPKSDQYTVSQYLNVVSPLLPGRRAVQCQPASEGFPPLAPLLDDSMSEDNDFPGTDDMQDDDDFSVSSQEAESLADDQFSLDDINGDPASFWNEQSPAEEVSPAGSEQQPNSGEQ